MLHTVTTSPFHTQSLQSCLRYISQDDEILLLQDAVFAGLRENILSKTIKVSGVKIYLLKEDLLARGIENKVDEYFEVVDYSGFVSLSIQHEAQMKWE
ncbi:sulfurtransferase complex subunit TusB [Photobacterium frigidiphilum]|uniref:sulfurtransferase complex subunit TusB n=1 Tax=Photobacterium frigidiphilum TaxID=264736 RepID=UPI003D0FAF39